MGIKYFFNRVLNIRNSYLIIILLVSILFIGLYFSYAILTTTQVKRGALNIAAGNLYPYIESEAFNEQSQVTVEAGSTKEITILLRNVNTIKTNLNLYYSSTSDLTNVSVRYIAGNSDVPPTGTGEVINTSENGDAEREYHIKIENYNNSSVTLTFGSSAGLVGRDLVLAEGCYAIEKVAQTVESQDNMVRVVYDETSSSWMKSDEENWYDYDNQKWANAVTINNTKVVDISNNGNTATIVNTTYSGVGESGEVELNGTDSYVDLGFANANLGNAWGVGIEFSCNSLPTSQRSLIGNWENSGGGLSYRQEYFQMNVYNSNTGAYAIARVELTLEVGKRYYVFGWVYNNNVYLYVKDLGFVSESTGTSDYAYSVSTYEMAVGVNPGSTYQQFSDITVYNAAIYNGTAAAEFGTSKDYVESNLDKMFDSTFMTSRTHAIYNFKRDNSIPDNTLIPIDTIDTMWTYIPRYSYTIGSEDGTNYYGKQGKYLSSTPTLAQPGEIDIKFVGKDVKEKGSANYIVSEGVSGWYTPDAFTFGSDELSGIWVGKFETSSSAPTETDGGGNVTTLDPMIKPNVASWRTIQVANIGNVGQKLTASGNIYGLPSELDSHAMKNDEWAAVAYLSQSKYGKLGNTNYTGANKEIYQNKSDSFITGCSYGAPANANTDYGCQYTYDVAINGTGASTTGTIYGIYDMSGGAWDYLMANLEKRSGVTSTSNSGYTGLLEDGTTFTGSSWLDDKYYNFYTSTDITAACNGKSCLSHVLDDVNGWYSDSIQELSITYPWSLRGGYYANAEIAGIFRNGRSGGRAYTNYGFRVVLVV